ncbi:hypothetical protein JHK84_048995 [Glycine max]|nr:hypothetical protein JHK86_048965 [Glycine max]KAG4923207.1 hypothetical protein JHK87_048747 [Glycine soja]KAG4934805.1 hypothetical protein JHK85_049724 [Glycine max]KAG5093407.1 hypothetical protein JHK84_048995 [Glycine max]
MHYITLPSPESCLETNIPFLVGAMQKGKHVELMLNRRVKMVKAKTNSDYDETEVDISLSHRLNAVKPSKTLSICHHATALLQADFDSPDVIAEVSSL